MVGRWTGRVEILPCPRKLDLSLFAQERTKSRFRHALATHKSSVAILPGFIDAPLHI